MVLGVVACLLAGAFWGLSFVAPLGVDPYSGFDLTVVRYVIFGVSSLIVLALMPSSPLRMYAPRDFALGMFLGLVGYVGHYGFLVVAVLSAGSHIPALIIGMVPLILMVAGNGTNGRVPWDALVLPMLCIGAGLLIINGNALVDAPDDASRGALLQGLLAAVISLVLWVWYAIANARALEVRPHVSSLSWTAVQGMGAGLGVILLIPLLMLFGLLEIGERGVFGAESGPLWFWALVLGVLATWGAGWLWIVASRRLPLAISGQLIVSDTVFGLLYGFMWEHRLPTVSEAAGIVLIFIGITVGIAAFGRTARAIAMPAE